MTPEELEKEMRNVFGIDGKGLKWKAARLYELLNGPYSIEVICMCAKLGEVNENKTGICIE